MATVSKMTVNGSEYDIIDSQARQDIVGIYSAITGINGDIADIDGAMNVPAAEYSLSNTPLGTITIGSGVNPTTGANMDSQYYCRTGFLRYYKPIVVVAPDGYLINAWCYSSHKTVTSKISTPYTKYTGFPFPFNNDNNARYIRIGFKKVNTAAITDDDVTAIRNGTKIYELNEEEITKAYKYNGQVVFHDVSNVSSTTINGLTYEIENNVITASALTETTGTTLVNLAGSTTVKPSWLKENTLYYCKLNKTGNDAAGLMIDLYKDSVNVATLYASSLDGPFILPDFSEFDGVIVRYWFPRGNTFSCTMSLEVLMQEPKDESRRIRIMQYNAGHFNMGRSTSDATYQYWTTDNDQAVMNAYRRLFSDYTPDIIGFEEYESSRQIRNASDISQVYRTADLNAELFDRVLPYSFAESSGGSKCAVKSKYPIIDARTILTSYTYTYEGTEYTHDLSYIYGHIDCNGVPIAFLTGYRGDATDAGAEKMAKRAAIFPILLDQIKYDVYGFLVIDANYSGLNPSTDNIDSSIAEGTALYNDIIYPAGYLSCVGSYFPWEKTYKSPRTNVIESLDNIYYKNWNHITLNSEDIPFELYDSLLSDHVPLICEFTIKA